jgi:6-pyruvoyl-tetrahydropterin synthase
MAKFYITDVMSRKKDDVDIGYIVVVNCEGERNSVETNMFVEKKDIPEATKESIIAIAEKWLNQKEGLKTVAETITEKLAVIEDERVEELIDSKELVISAAIAPPR